ncbi:hypothetical protein LTR36_009479 [Oleoguttula mirabilis]|uniref:BZIP domain-containing protein n=1 Tax=Oleoguttula mirabilis TaxID=1507867 RepID=A0AAV9JSV7_9PEZI|nr:hypothetical protein LTR36_009479 [Oleoguttula mirabilis]
MAATSKIETGHDEGTPSSIESTPEQDGLPEISQEPAVLPQKRKGGRKPIYATSEERKQRNRQAQAAFRERRTEYIKQLEATIKQNEDALSTLQQSHRTAADECLMLRYKNSLLERILLEKGIDVQAELRIKTGSPVLPQGYTYPTANVPQVQAPQPPLQRAAVHRQQARRSGGAAFLPKLAPGQGNPEISFPTSSPQGHPTPSSHGSSPTNVPTRSPMAMHQGGMTPPASTVLAQGQAQQYHGYARSSQQPPNHGYYSIPQQPQNLVRQPQRPPPPSQYQSSASVVSSLSTGSQHSLNPPPIPPMMSAGQSSINASAGPSSASAYYPSPFQKHIDQLEQEYDTQQPQSMLDHPEHDADHRPTTSPHQLQGTYPPQFDQPQQQQQARGPEYYQQAYGAQNGQQQMAPHPHYDQSQMMTTSQAETASGVQGPFAMGQVIDPNDPMLDADPFGLSASMHYPTSYSSMSRQAQHR